MADIVLIHSPLVGPFTWALVAEELRRQGMTVVAPDLHERVDEGIAYWAQHAGAVARALAGRADPEPVVLAGHSGAGMLLPACRELMERPPAGYIFVDAGLPENGKSRLDLFENHDAVAQFRQAASGGLLPAWTDEDLRALIPAAEVRERFVSELKPIPLALYEEPLPVFDGWPDAPCGYLHFSPVYDSAARRAQQMGWPYRKLEGGHFHMLVDPQTVSAALIELARAMS
jgi:hypothetical protein